MTPPSASEVGGAFAAGQVDLVLCPRGDHLDYPIEKLAGTFNRLASTLTRDDEVRRAAAADVAHELRTPAGIVSRIETAAALRSHGAQALRQPRTHALRFMGYVPSRNITVCTTLTV